MNVKTQIKEHIAAQDEGRRSDMEAINRMVLKISPKCRLWFEDGTDGKGKKVTNPNVGYGFYTIKYANGKTRDFFRIGMAATSAGLSVYILGLADKTYLAKTFGKKIGKAKVTGYCISFKSLKDIDTAVLQEAIRYGLAEGS